MPSSSVDDTTVTVPLDTSLSIHSCLICSAGHRLVRIKNTYIIIFTIFSFSAQKVLLFSFLLLHFLFLFFGLEFALVMFFLSFFACFCLLKCIHTYTYIYIYIANVLWHEAWQFWECRLCPLGWASEHTQKEIRTSYLCILQMHSFFFCHATGLITRLMLAYSCAWNSPAC